MDCRCSRLLPAGVALLLALFACAASACGKTDPPITCPDGTQYRRVKIDGLITAACVDAEQRLHGPALSWHTDQPAHKQREGEYRNGHKVGTWRSWDPAGKELTVEQYDDQGNLIPPATSGPAEHGSE